MDHDDYIMRPLGRTGFMAGRLGISGGYGAPAEAIEMAYEKGVNYFYHGSLRRDAMTQAIKKITAQGQREKIFVVAQNYWRMIRWPIMRSFESFMKKPGSIMWTVSCSAGITRNLINCCSTYARSLRRRSW